MSDQHLPPPTGAPGAAVSPWAPLRGRVFRFLFLAQLVSNIGTWMQTVGAQWFLVEHGNDPVLISLVQTASLTPALLLSLLAGVLADLLDRRRLLIVMSAYSGVTAAVLAVLSFADVLTPWSLLVMTFLIGLGAALSAPAWQAIQPELVPREQIPAASSLGSVSVNGARAVGPAVAGFLVAWAGPGLVFAINAVSFVGIVVGLAAWRRSTPSRVVDREHVVESLLTGLRYVRAAPGVRRIVLRSALFGLPASCLWALLPIASSQHLRLSSSGYGVVLGALGVGALLGVAVMPRLRASYSPNVLLATSAIAYAAGVVGVAYLPFWPALVVLLLAGAAWIFTLTTLNAAMQLTLATWVRARGMAVYLLVFAGSQALGSVLWGAVAARLGYAATLLISAVALLLVALSIVWLPLLARTGSLDRSISLAWPTPTLVFEPAPDDGPVLVETSYQVAPEAQSRFLQAMEAVERSRRRTGATNWRLYRSGEDANRLVEQFLVPSWAEHQRQHAERWTGFDQESLSDAVAYTQEHQVEERTYLAV